MQLVAELKTKQNLSNLTEVKPLRCHRVILYLKISINTFQMFWVLLGVGFGIVMQAHQAVYATVITDCKKYKFLAVD